MKGLSSLSPREFSLENPQNILDPTWLESFAQKPFSFNSSLYLPLFENSNSCMKTSRDSAKIEVALRKEATPDDDAGFTTASRHRLLLLLFRAPRGDPRSIRSSERATGCEQASDAIDRVTGATWGSAISFVETRGRGTWVRFYAEKSVSFV